MNWEDIREFRKAGQLQQAIDAATEILSNNPDNFLVKSQYEWVIYDCIKMIVNDINGSLEKSRPVKIIDVNELIAWVDTYKSLNPRIPELVCSNILSQIVKVGIHLPTFTQIIDWIGIARLREEDWQPRQYQGKTFPSLAMSIARTLCKWVKSHPDATQIQMAQALEWAEKVGKVTSADDSLWLHWDMAILLRQMGNFHRAAEILASVIKNKRNEFWVCSEAGRLYQSEQPELALACYCRALECPSEPQFLVRTHRELAELLAAQQEYAQASLEVALTIDIRKEQGWPIGREMEELIASHWYDAEAKGAVKPKDFYSKYSSAALTLCFDTVETKNANYLGSIVSQAPKDPRPGWKPKLLSRFAIKDSNGQAWTLITPGMKNLKFNIGAPLTAVIGRQSADEKQLLIHVSIRNDGHPWDCLDSNIGVITSEVISDKMTKALIVETGEEVNIDMPSNMLKRIGDGIKCYTTRNPKNNRMEVFNIEHLELNEKILKYVKGQLRRNTKGFGFIEDAFVPPNIVESIVSSNDEVSALAIFAKNPSKGEYGWRVIEIRIT